MKVHFFGARSVIPTPGPDTVRFGGNTHCLILESRTGQKLIINAGSGLRLANPMFDKAGDVDRVSFENNINILLSQSHWDHIQGFPLFEPIHDANQNITIYPPDHDEHHDTAILDQIAKGFSVEKFHQLPANITIKRTRFDSATPVEMGDFAIQSMRVNHPHGGNAFRIECDDKTIVIANNNELFAPQEHCFHNFDEWVLFCNSADMLLHDARFMDPDMVSKIGGGHSCLNDVIELATAANIKLLGLTCHDPMTTDETLDFLTSRLFKERPPFSFFYAKEGRVMRL